MNIIVIAMNVYATVINSFPICFAALLFLLDIVNLSWFISANGLSISSSVYPATTAAAGVTISASLTIDAPKYTPVSPIISMNIVFSVGFFMQK